jgi:hypothetical protein
MIRVQHYLEHGEKECVLARSSLEKLHTNVTRALKLAAHRPWKLYWGKSMRSDDKPLKLTADTFAAMLAAYDEEPSEVCVYAFLPTDTEPSPLKPPAAEEGDTLGPLPDLGPTLSSPRARSETASDSTPTATSGGRSRESAAQQGFRAMLYVRHGADPRCAICGVSWRERKLDAAHVIAHELFAEGKDTAAMTAGAINVIGPNIPQNGILLCNGFCHHLVDKFYLTVVATEDRELVVELGEHLLEESTMYRPLHGKHLTLPSDAERLPLHCPSEDVWRMAEERYRREVKSWDAKKRRAKLVALRRHRDACADASAVAAGAGAGGGES